MKPFSRRKLLASAGAATLSLSGCVGKLPFTSSGGDEDLVVSTLDVAGSPGTDVQVTPPGTPALIDFFATYCQPCKPQMAHLRTVHEQYPALHLLSVSWEQDTDAIRQFWQEYDGTWPVAQDTDVRVGAAFGVDSRLPTKVLVDGSGNEVWRSVGLSSAEKIASHVEDAFETDDG